MTNSSSHRESHGRQLPLRDRIVGAALLLGIIALLFFLRTPDEPSPVADLLLPPPAALDSTWVERTPETAVWQSARSTYLSGDYGNSAKQLATIADREDDDAPMARLFLGSSYLLEGRPKSAELALRLAVRADDGDVSHEARWQLAVSFLRQEEIEEGRAELEAIGRDDGPHSGTARALLEQLGTQSSRLR